MRPATDAQRDYIQNLLDYCTDKGLDIWDYVRRASSMVLTVGEASELIDEMKEELGWD